MTHRSCSYPISSRLFQYKMTLLKTRGIIMTHLIARGITLSLYLKDDKRTKSITNICCCKMLHRRAGQSCKRYDIIITFLKHIGTMICLLSSSRILSQCYRYYSHLMIKCLKRLKFRLGIIGICAQTHQF